MKREQNQITYKIKYSCTESLLDIIKQYNSVLRFTYNRLSENPKLKTSEITIMQHTLNNVDLIGSHLKNSATYDAKVLVKGKHDNIIFGGRSLFIKRCQNKITRDEFLIKRLLPICSIGESNNRGNRLFTIVDEQTIEFKLNRNKHFTLNLVSVGRKRTKELRSLIKMQNSCSLPITYKLDLDYIYITFDYSYICQQTYKTKENRVIAIDMNPNSVGWSVVDWKSENRYKVIQSGTFEIKPLNDYRNSKHIASTDKLHKYATNKRNHEVVHIAKHLFDLCKHYKCEVFAIEDLNIQSSEKGKGRRFNKLCNNNWNRNLLVNQIRKRILASSTTFVEVQPQYNSYIGNLIFRINRLPDECLASIEIGRRGFEFATQYLFNRRSQKKTIIFPDIESVKNQLTLSLEELGVDIPELDSWKNILSVVKKSGVKYRFSKSVAKISHTDSLFSKFYKQKFLIVTNYL